MTTAAVETSETEPRSGIFIGIYAWTIVSAVTGLVLDVFTLQAQIHPYIPFHIGFVGTYTVGVILYFLIRLSR